MDLAIDNQRDSINQADSHGSKIGERQPGWIAEYHGPIRQTGSNLLFTPSKKPGEFPRRSPVPFTKDSKDWVRIRVSKLHPDTSSQQFNRFLKEVSNSPKPTKCLRRLPEPMNSM